MKGWQKKRKSRTKLTIVRAETQAVAAKEQQLKMKGIAERMEVQDESLYIWFIWKYYWYYYYC